MADYLTRREGNAEINIGKNRMQIMLKPKAIDPEVLAEQEPAITNAPIEQGLHIVDKTLQQNRTARSIEELASVPGKKSKDGNLLTVCLPLTTV